MHISRQWRDMQVCKQFGFGHDTYKTPGDGDLADFCPACPQPGINLPEDWYEQEERYTTSCLAMTMGSLTMYHNITAGISTEKM
jgi:hypothetical protein